MTIAGLKQSDFLKILKANGYDIISTEYWDTNERVMIGKGSATFAIKLKRFYFYWEVIPRFKSLEIAIIPEDCQEDYDFCVHCFKDHKK